MWQMMYYRVVQRGSPFFVREKPMYEIQNARNVKNMYMCESKSIQNALF